MSDECSRASTPPIGRHVVVLGGQRQIGPADRAAGLPQALERLRAGHLVHQVQVDVQQVGLTLRGVHDVCVPDLFGERLPHCDLLLGSCVVRS